MAAKELLGSGVVRIQPRLRVISNGNVTVNAIRAEQAGAVKVEDRKVLKDVAPLLTQEAAPIVAEELPKAAKRGSIKELASGIRTSVFIQITEAFKEKGRLRENVTGAREDILTAEVSLEELKELSETEGVLYIEAGSNLKPPTPDISAPGSLAPPVRRFSFGKTSAHRNGENVLVGLIDVNGFDFCHEDFLDSEGKTRFLKIWDQGGSTHSSPNENGTASFDYGSEILKQHMDAAISQADSVGLPPFELEPQAGMQESSHGTHVASIAAGNRGVCKKAMIAAVNLSLPAEDLERRKSFYDSTRIAHAVEYLINVAEQIGAERGVAVPLVINISLGTNGHAHDGSSPLSRWIDSALSVPGRAMCVAAGNAGQEVAEFEGDVGYVMGRIHTSGKIASRGLLDDIEWLVVGNGISDISENELEIWYSSQDRFEVSIKPPGLDWIGPIRPREFIENRQLPDKSMLSVYNEMFHSANGCNYISVYLSPFFSDSGIVGVSAGKWTVRLRGAEVRDGNYHGWIERNDPRKLGRIGDREAWRFPSFFSERSMVDNSSVNTLACGFRIISVANLDEAREMIHKTSSQGPTRDGRLKPDVAAPGTDVLAANGFATGSRKWIEMTGTSMASPFVSGVVGLMLATEPSLTAAQIEGIMQCSSQPLPGMDYEWRDSAGFGRIDPEKCLEEAGLIGLRKDITGQ